MTVTPNPYENETGLFTSGDMGDAFAAGVAAERARTEELRAAAAWLLRLKDGPRDEVYYETKGEAWRALRAALDPEGGSDAA